MLVTSPQLRQLADALRPALGLSISGSAAEPGIELARFASERHRVGPLLHRAWSGASNVDSETMGLLEQVSASNTRRELRQKAATRKFGKLLDASAIGWIEFKGWRLGAELYGESALRQSKDVDILLPPERVADALTLAAGAGFRIGGKDGDFGLRKARWVLRHHREVGIVDPEMQVEIELHSRLLGYPPDGWRDPGIGHSAGGGTVSIEDPDYVLYLIVHGALTGWKRLKWLCDMVMLTQRVSPEVRGAVIVRSRVLGCEAALVASLLAVAELWDGEIIAPWLAETEASPEDADVQGHLSVISRRLSLAARPQFVERAMRHAGILRDTAVFGRHPAPLREFRDRAALWLLAKL